MALVRSVRKTAFLIAGGYAVIAAVWIVASDWGVLIAFGAERLAQLQTIKGLAFVTVTSLTLYLIVRVLLGRAASAMESEAALKERLDRVHMLLTEAATLFLSVDDERELLDAVCERVVTIGGFSGAWAGTLDANGGISVLASYRASAMALLEASDKDACGPTACPMRRSLTGGGTTVDNDVLSHATGRMAELARDAGIRSVASIPVVRAGAAYRALCVFSAEPNAFGPAETVALERLGADLASGLERVAAARERTEMLSLLEESERRYRDMFLSAPRPMWVYDLETLRFLAVNDAAVAHYGYGREEFLAMAITDIRPAQEVKRLAENIARITEGLDKAGVWKHVTADGKVLDVEITSHVLDWEGRRAELVFADDVTAVLDSARARERALARLKTIIETPPVPIIVSYADGTITAWNSAAETVFGWSPAEVLGTPNPIVPRDEWEGYLGVLRDLETVGTLPPFEARRVTKGGRPIDAVVYTAALETEPGDPREFVAVVVDITERVRIEAELTRHRQHLEELVEERTGELRTTNEELQRATRVKSEFLASMSHELRTPLNSIIGFSGVLLQGLAGALTPEQETQVRMINRSGNHLLALINDVLDLSKIESGQLHLECARFDMCEIVRPVVETLTAHANEKGLALTIECPDREFMVWADKLRVEQILFNLVGNALKFTEEGSVTVRVTERAGAIEVDVVDTGPGVSPDEHELVFQEFQQSPHTSSDRPGGTGLGLTISRRLARLMGGDVTLASGPGSGSVFTLSLPAEDDRPRAPDG